jgi:hypothetical protein
MPVHVDIEATRQARRERWQRICEAAGRPEDAQRVPSEEEFKFDKIDLRYCADDSQARSS